MKFNKYILGLAAAAALMLALPAAAQQSIPVKIYPLTNSLAGTTNCIAMTNGFTMLSSNCTYTVSSQPFQIWRGRGFAFHAGIQATNANNPVCTFTFRFADVHLTNWGSGTGTVTNWSTLNPVSVVYTPSGTTEVFPWTNFPATTVDNVQFGQLYTIGVSAIAGAVQLDPTNTYIGVYP